MMRACTSRTRALIQICGMTNRFFSNSLTSLQIKQQSEVNNGADSNNSSNTDSNRSNNNNTSNNKNLQVSSSTSKHNEDGEESKTHSTEENVRQEIIQRVLSLDKEIFELKRLHELSMLRVEQNQKRILQNQEDRAMYFEQTFNVETFDTVSVGLHTERNTLFHTMALEQLRNVKCMITLWATFLTCGYLYYKYIVNTEYMYVGKSIKQIGSQRQLARDILWEQMTEEEKIAELNKSSKYSTTSN